MSAIATLDAGLGDAARTLAAGIALQIIQDYQEIIQVIHATSSVQNLDIE